MRQKKIIRYVREEDLTYNLSHLEIAIKNAIDKNQEVSEICKGAYARTEIVQYFKYCQLNKGTCKHREDLEYFNTCNYQNIRNVL